MKTNALRTAGIFLLVASILCCLIPAYAAENSREIIILADFDDSDPAFSPIDVCSTDGGDIRTKATVYAHRGYHVSEPDNSLGALRAAAARGFGGTETDAHKTKDGKFVCFHDCNVLSMLGVNRRIEDMTYAELQTLPLPNGETVPTVEQWIHVSRELGLKIYIELKHYMNINDCMSVWNICQKYKENIVFGSNDINTCKNMRTIAPRAVIYHLCSSVNRNLIETYKEKNIGCQTNYRNFKPEQYSLFTENGIPLNFYLFTDLDTAMSYVQKYNSTFLLSDTTLWDDPSAETTPTLPPAQKPATSNTQNGWSLQNGVWYWYKNGSRVTNSWIQTGGKWYWMKKDGSMAHKEWIIVDGKRYYFAASGSMLTGWACIDELWYYFDSSGKMARNGWINSSNNWYFVDPDGRMLEGLCKISLGRADDGLYLFNPVHDGTYGRVLTGWRFVDDSWYYFNPNHNGTFGRAYTGGTYMVEGNRCTFDYDGKLMDEQKV